MDAEEEDTSDEEMNEAAAAAKAKAVAEVIKSSSGRFPSSQDARQWLQPDAFGPFAQWQLTGSMT